MSEDDKFRANLCRILGHNYDEMGVCLRCEPEISAQLKHSLYSMSVGRKITGNLLEEAKMCAANVLETMRQEGKIDSFSDLRTSLSIYGCPTIFVTVRYPQQLTNIQLQVQFS